MAQRMLGLFVSRESKMLKKAFLIIALVTAAITVFKMINSDHSKSFSSMKYESHTQNKNTPTPAKAPKHQGPQNKVIPSKKKTVQRPLKVAFNKQDKHSAQTDSKGHIYPRTIAIDDDMLIAYGDLIVGSTDDLSAYQNGDKTLDIPPPDLWPQGSIPFEIDDSIKDNPLQVDTIKKVVNSLNEWAKLNIHPRQEGEKNYVLFKRGTQHCYANIGFRLGVTNVSLSAGCGEKEIFHEFFHVLGFFHEQNRTDRDNFIQILWENIDEENWSQFEKFSTKSYPLAFQNLNSIPFTFDSIMLYDSQAFSNTSDYSMVRTDGTPFSVSSRRPTPIDLDRVKILYPPRSK